MATSDWMNSTNILPLLCGGALEGLQMETFVCEANYDGLEVELRSLFKWDILMAKVSVSGGFLIV